MSKRPSGIIPDPDAPPKSMKARVAFVILALVVLGGLVFLTIAIGWR